MATSRQPVFGALQPGKHTLPVLVLRLMLEAALTVAAPPPLRNPQDKAGADPNRVGGPVNPLLSDGGMSTIIAAGKGTDRGMLNNLKRMQARAGWGGRGGSCNWARQQGCGGARARAS